MVLTLATNAIATWTTEYCGLAIAALRRGGRVVDKEVMAQLWPSHHEHIHRQVQAAFGGLPVSQLTRVADRDEP